MKRARFQEEYPEPFATLLADAAQACKEVVASAYRNTPEFAEALRLAFERRTAELEAEERARLVAELTPAVRLELMERVFDERRKAAAERAAQPVDIEVEIPMGIESPTVLPFPWQKNK